MEVSGAQEWEEEGCMEWPRWPGTGSWSSVGRRGIVKESSEWQQNLRQDMGAQTTCRFK